MKKFLLVTLVFIMVLTLPVSVCADSLYLYENFEGNETIKTYNLNPKKSTAQVVTDSVNKNSYVHLENKAGLSDCFLDFEFGKCAENVVLEFDIQAPVISSSTSNTGLVMIRDENNFVGMPSCNIMFFRNDGMQVRGSSDRLKDTKKIYHIAYEIDLKNDKYNAYVDGVSVKQEMAIGADFEEISLLRFYLSTADNAEICIDNIKFYEGTSIRDVSGETVTPIYEHAFSHDFEAVRILNGKTAVQGYSQKLFYNNEKKDCTLPPYNIDDETYLSLEDLKNVLNCEITTENDKITVDGCVFYKDNFYALKDGKKFLLEYEPKAIGTSIYLPVEETAKLVGKYTENDLHGLIVISDSPISISETNLNEANDYMFHKRYSKDELKNFFDTQKSNSEKENFHPRLLATQADFDRIRADNSEIMTSWKNSGRVIGYADYYCNKGEDTILSYKLEGLRLLNVSSEAVRRIMALSFAYQMTFEEKYLRRAIKELDAVCSFDDWNAMAHFLDAGEMCFAVAIGYDWLYDYLTEEQKLRYETKIKEYALLPAYNVYYKRCQSGESYWWRSSETNWNGVCNGGIACGAMAIWETDPEFCSDIVSKATRSLECALYAMGPDGAWKEGIGYMNYYLSYLTRFLATSKIALGTHFGFFDYKGMDKILYYHAGISSKVGTNNFHDSSDVGYVLDSAHYFSNVYKNDDFSYLRLDSIENGEYIVGGSNSISVTDVLWCKNPEIQKEISLSKDLHYRDIEVVSMRENYEDENAMFMSFHGGSYEGAHDHYDAGTFVYDVLGERWVMDLGSGNYDIGTHETNYHTRTEGHNTVVIAPSEEPGQDTDGYANVEKLVSGDTEAVSILDLSTYYPDTVNSYRRAYYVSDNRRSLSVYDEIDLKDKNELWWFMHTKANIVPFGKNHFLLTKNGKCVNVCFEISDENAEVGYMAAKPLPTSPQVVGQTNGEGVSKLYVKTKTSGKLQIVVKISPANEGYNIKPDLKNIDEISISETQNNFSKGAYSSLFGRKSTDNSEYAQNLSLNAIKNNLPQNSRVRLSFYKAFSDYDYTINAYGRKNGNKSEVDLGNLLTFTQDGKIRLFDTVIEQNNSRFVKNKWYKIDLYLGFSDMDSYKTTVDLYIDNVKICENQEIFSGSKIDAVTRLVFDGCYIDDYIVRYAFSGGISNISPTFSDWDYDKNISFKNGVYLFDDINHPYNSKALWGEGIKAYEFYNGYFVITTQDDEKVYAPVFILGEKLFESENASSISFDGLKGDIFTLKAKALTDGTAVVSMGDLQLSEIKNNDEFAVTFYKNSGICEVYVNGKLYKKLSYESLSSLNVSGGSLKDVFLYTGGITNDIRISDISVSKNKGSFSAQSIKSVSGKLVMAFYKDKKLMYTQIKDICVLGENKEYSIEETYNDYDEIKVFFMDFETLKPYKNNGYFKK